MKAVKGKEIVFTGENKVGELAEVAGAIKDRGINIRAISAWAVEGKAVFRLVTSDSIKTKELLSAKGNVEEKEVIIAEMPDEVGQLQFLASKLKDNNIDLAYIYGTTRELGKAAIIVFASDNNDKALEAISA
ncbi:MAG: ACT domain-containing protein [Candidatus Omnitrophica bacterium]|nr:ACT domain-containing protein [Candidatus Omnitrophota bacterium]